MERDLHRLPPGLPRPDDDGGADHLRGQRVPAVALPSTSGEEISIASPAGAPRTIVYAFPHIGRPDRPLPAEDWDLIPGARGCTPQSCAFRDHHQELLSAGAAVVGLSSQPLADLREAADRLHLPFPLLSDAALTVTRALRLPTMTVGGRTLIKRLTMVIKDGQLEHTFYPVFPPDQHPDEVLTWLASV